MYSLLRVGVHDFAYKGCTHIAFKANMEIEVVLEVLYIVIHKTNISTMYTYLPRHTKCKRNRPYLLCNRSKS